MSDERKPVRGLFSPPTPVEALEEIAMNCRNLLAGGLSWFSREDIARAVLGVAEAGIRQAEKS
jgi:hypothetical protein